MGDVHHRRGCRRRRSRYQCHQHRRGLCRRPAAGVGSQQGTVVGRTDYRPSRGRLGRMCRRLSPLPRTAATAGGNDRARGPAAGFLHRCTRSARWVALGHRRPRSHPHLLPRRRSRNAGDLSPRALRAVQGGGSHGAGRQLLRHRKRGRALPAIRLLPLARYAGGSHRTAPQGASLASGRAHTGFAHLGQSPRTRGNAGRPQLGLDDRRRCADSILGALPHGQFIYEPSQRHWPIIVRFHLGDQLGRESLCLCYRPVCWIAKQLPLQVVPIFVFS